MWVREAITAGDLQHLVANMRPQDAREVFALRQTEDRVALGFQLFGMLPYAQHAFVAGVDNQRNATAFLGIWAMDETGGLASANLFATAEFPLLAGALVRHVRRSVIPALLTRGCRRVECRALAAYRTNRRFIRACGAVEEAVLPDYGKGREAFMLCAWRRSDWEKDRHGEWLHVHPRGRACRAETADR